jgi:hypothetical protein
MDAPPARIVRARVCFVVTTHERAPRCRGFVWKIGAMICRFTLRPISSR